MANQTQNFLAMMSNFETALKATDTAMNSLNSASKENAKYMESVSAKIQDVKRTFQDLSTSLLSSEGLKTALDLVNNSLKALNTESGQSLTKVIIPLTAIWALVSKLKGLRIIQAMFGVGGGSSKLAKNITTITSGTTAISKGLGMILTVGKRFIPWLAAIHIGVTVLKGVYDTFFKDTKSGAEKLNDELNKSNETLKTNKDRLSEIKNTEWRSLTPEIEAERAALELENEVLERKLKLLKEQKGETYFPDKIGITEQKINLDVADWNSFTDVKERKSSPIVTFTDLFGNKSLTELEKWFSSSQYSKVYNTVEDMIYDIGLSYKFVYDTVDKSVEEVSLGILDINNKLRDNADLSNEEKYFITQINTVVKDTVQQYRDWQQAGGQLTSEQQHLVDVYDEFLSIATKLDSTLVLSPEQVERLKQKSALLGKVIEENNGVYSISAEKLAGLNFTTVEAKKALFDLIKQETIFNGTDLTTEKSVENIKTLIGAMIGLAEAESVVTGMRGITEFGEAHGLIDEEIQAMQQDYLNEKLNALRDKISIPSQPISGLGSGSATSTSTAPVDKALESFQYLYRELQHRRNLDEISEEEYYNELEKLMQDYISDATKHMKEYGLTVDKINQNMYSYEEEIYKGRKQLAEDLARQQQKLADDLDKFLNKNRNEEIEALREQQKQIEKEYDARIEQLQKMNDEIDRQIELERLQEELSKARQRKMLVFKDGRYQYVSDIDEVSKAQQELDENRRKEEARLEAERLEAEKQDKLDRIDTEISRVEQQKPDYSKIWWDLERSDLPNKKELQEYVHQLKTEEMAGSGLTYHPDTGRWYAKGTTSAKGGLSVVGEKGPELRVLNRGDGILPADITKNMWGWGQLNPNAVLSSVAGFGGMNVNIQTLNLPEVKDGQDFVNYLTNNFMRLAVQSANKNN